MTDSRIDGSNRWEVRKTGRGEELTRGTYLMDGMGHPGEGLDSAGARRSSNCHISHGRGHGGTMKLLLTSGGVTNASIRDALVEMLGKPIADATALCIPTAQWGHPMCGPTSVRGFVTGLPPWGGMTSMEWKSLGILELTALPTIGAERWVPWVGRPMPCSWTAATRRTCATGCESPGSRTSCHRCPTRPGWG